MQRPIAIGLNAIGSLFAVYILIFKREGGFKDLTDFAGSALELAGPWLAVDFLLVWLRWYRGFIVAGCSMLLLEFYIYNGVFIHPQSSTDAIAYVFKPGVQLLILLPMGLLIGRALDKHSVALTTKK